jgi:predicted amidohydrolase YtcJ
MDPLIGVYSALTRARLDGTDAWQTNECVSLETALRAYTMGGAYAIGAERDRGSIAVGKYADLVVLDRNPFELEPSALLQTQVLATVVAGEVVYRG